jgi:hypothetical protein
MEEKLRAIFKRKKPIIGMIHLAGNNQQDRIKRALEELAIYQEEGVDGAIIEDYHGTSQDVYETLRESLTKGLKIVRGVNVLRNPYSAFKLALDFGAKFIQFDSVQTPDLNLELYNQLRKEYFDIAVLGGVGFKYIEPTGNSLEVDLEEGISRCEAIVTTGSGTGIETPIEKLREYKRLLGDFSLIVGAGVNLQNISEQLQICDGAIVGSYFKPNGDTHLSIDRKRVKDLMDIVVHLREQT